MLLNIGVALLLEIKAADIRNWGRFNKIGYISRQNVTSIKTWVKN